MRELRAGGNELVQGAALQAPSWKCPVESRHAERKHGPAPIGARERPIEPADPHAELGQGVVRMPGHSPRARSAARARSRFGDAHAARRKDTCIDRSI